MKKTIFTLTLFAIIWTSYGQNVWQQLYNNNTANTFTQTQENKFILAGSEYDAMMQKWNIFQTDSVGNIQWDTTFYQVSEGIPECIESTPDTGYIIAGNNGGNAYFLKFDKYNNLNWESNICINSGGVQAINSIIRTNENNYISTGCIISPTTSFLIVKINENGDSLWTRKYFENTFSYGVSIVESFDTGYYCLASKSNDRTILLKINESGDTLWTKTINSEYIPTSMIKTNDNCLMISANENSHNLVFIKVDIYGNTLWTKKYSTNSTYNYCTSISTTLDNGYITANRMSYSPENEYRLWIMKLDATGDSIFSILSLVDLRPEKIIQTNDSLFVFLANDFINNPRLVKTDSIGNIITTLQELNNSNRNKLKCFPNPFENEITIEIDKTEGFCAQLTIYNIMGEVIFSNKDFFMSSEKINTTSLKKGIYVVELVINNVKYTSLIEKK